MGWRLQVNFTDGTDVLVDDIFETEEDAENEANEWLEGWEEGQEVLTYANRDCKKAAIEDFDIWEE